MLTPYFGEFLQNPIPLEMSIGQCNHGCAYCFATSKPQSDRDGDKEVQAQLRFLASYHDKHSHEAQLLKLGYPVVVSNRTDPFSRNGERQVLPIMEVMRDMGIPMMYQTKGGRKALDFAKTVPPSFWYVSISFDVDHTKQCRQIEPGAPSPQERLDMVKALVKMGHTVVVGWNPCVQDWITNPYDFALTLKNAGAWGVWAESVHLSKQLTSTMSPERLAKLGDLPARSLDKERPFEDFRMLAREACRHVGLEVFGGYQYERSDFWTPTKTLYEHTFPIYQDAINYLHDTQEDGCQIYSSWFANWMIDRLPTLTKEARCGHILASQSWKIAGEPGYSNHLTLPEVVNFGMRNKKSVFHPAKFWGFAYEADLDENGDVKTIVVDENNDPTFLFCKTGKKWDYMESPE